MMISSASPARGPGREAEDDALDRIERERLLDEATGGNGEPGTSGAKAPTATSALDRLTAQSDHSSTMQLLFCFVGLQVSYLTWGVMQEKIMTTKYTPTPLVPDGQFPSATFCVFSNRALAIVVAAAICMKMHKSLQTAAPLWYYSPCALSNTLSSWGQYAALKFVSFPLQVLFKSAKVIPVMLMGKVLNKATFPMVEYIEAIVITLGVATFGLSKPRSGGGAEETTGIFGILCLTLYICSDAFTSQWQDRIYKAYPKQIDQYQMMFGVNCSAIIITILALLVSNEIPAVLDFFSVNPSALIYNIVTAITSATGQLFIFYTIKQFGPVVFTIIMTTRQMISMVISTIFFGHSLTFGSYVGAALVFGAVFYRIRRKQLARAAKAQQAPGR